MHRRGTWCTMVILYLQMGKLPGDGTLGIKLTIYTYTVYV